MKRDGLTGAEKILRDSDDGWVVDIDDVLAETSLKAIEHMYELGFVTKWEPAELKQKYEFGSVVPEWQYEDAQIALGTIYRDLNFLLSLPVREGAQDALNGDSACLKVRFYMTSRMPDQYWVTKQWLKQHGFPEAPLVTRKPNEHRGYWKIEYLLDNAIEVAGLVDDNKAAFFGHREFTGRRIWLNDTQVSNSGLHKQVIRLPSWSEISRLLVPESERTA